MYTLNVTKVAKAKLFMCSQFSVRGQCDKLAVTVVCVTLRNLV